MDAPHKTEYARTCCIPNEMFNNLTAARTKGRSCAINKSYVLAAGRSTVHKHAEQNFVLLLLRFSFKPLQRSCLPKDPTCAARSNHKVQYDVWQVWASESKTNIFLYFWLNKVLQEKIAFLQRVLKKKNYLVSFASILPDYVMGLVVRSCSRLMEEFSRNVCFAALKWRTTSVEAITQLTRFSYYHSCCGRCCSLFKHSHRMSTCYFTIRAGKVWMFLNVVLREVRLTDTCTCVLKHWLFFYAHHELQAI